MTFRRKQEMSGRRVGVLCRVVLSLSLIGILCAVSLQAAQDFATHNQRGVDLSAQGRHREAIAELEKALALAPGHAVVRRNLAHAHGNAATSLLQERAFRDAAAEYQAAIDLYDEEPRFYMGLGVALLGLRDTDRAVESLRRARDLNPKEGQVYRLLGEAYFQRGDMREAIGAWQEGLRIRPGDRDLERLIAQAEGERKVDEEYRRRPGHHFTLRYVGEVREELGQEILQLLERAYEEVGYNLNHFPRQEIEVVIYSDADFQRVMGLPGWVHGAYDERGGRIRIPVRGIKEATDLRGLLYHEYTHVVVREVTGGRVPTWLNEGLAQIEQRTPMDGAVESVRQLAARGKLPPLESLKDPFVGLTGPEAGVAYAISYAATKYLIERWSLWDTQRLLRRLGEGVSFDVALKETTRLTLADFEREWVTSLGKGE
jgi:tetratricopeptide (TPR) repeat protein